MPSDGTTQDQGLNWELLEQLWDRVETAKQHLNGAMGTSGEADARLRLDQALTQLVDAARSGKARS
jgi:hypothetical protein